ncbi:ferritin family protein [Fervidobacterium riparium]|uniref:Rubrerythrin n=1 Tax=Fervidobacterium gondwanense DSM 13020 TaxID=1121883 RepID=A0A1M7T8M5_FERGO|nr:ferritin family protein [Fervidobacterium gondwanense]UXF01336.1 rubrerythrin [Fervidobacterium riparium]SHN67046.1 Rubrerythrin [Fervidobacterium gondwanense DSM 13020]
MEKIIGILRFALMREIEGREFYKEKAKKVSSKDIKDILEGLANMENDHVHFIEGLMKKAQNNIEITIEDTEVAMAKSDFFEEREKSETVTGTLDEMANDLAILRMAYLIEEDFEKFYRQSAEKVADEEMKKILNILAIWEEGHKKVLLEAYDEARKTYWNQQGFEPLF